MPQKLIYLVGYTVSLINDCKLTSTIYSDCCCCIRRKYAHAYYNNYYVYARARILCIWVRRAHVTRSSLHVTALLYGGKSIMKSSSRHGSMYSQGEGDMQVQRELGLSRSMTIARRALVGQNFVCGDEK